MFNPDFSRRIWGRCPKGGGDWGDAKRVAEAIQSVRGKCPQGEAEEYFRSSQKMAADSSAPKELQELGRVLQRIMLGDKNVDL